MTDRVLEAALWLATTPQERRPHPLLLHIQKTFALTAAEAVSAIREANNLIKGSTT